MASSMITINDLRKQCSLPTIKYQCKLCPLAERHFSSQSDLVELTSNPNPKIFEWLFQQPGISYNNIIMWSISSNPSAIAFLESYPNKEKIFIPGLLENPNITQKLFDLALEQRSSTRFKGFFEVDYKTMSANPNPIVVDYMLQHPDKIVWNEFSKNTNTRAVALLRENPDKISWYYLSRNENTDAIALLEANVEMISFDQLSFNSHPQAIDLLMQFPRYINYNNLSANTNPRAVKLLVEKHADEIVWREFSANPAAIDYLENHVEKINFTTFWTNPNIFAVDYQAMCKDRSALLSEDLMQVALHPDRIDRLCREGYSVDEIMGIL